MGKYSIGRQVSLRSSPESIGIIQSVQENVMGTTYYSVFFDAGNAFSYPEESLDEVVDPNKVEYVGRDVFLKNLLMTKLNSRLTDTLFSYKASRTNIEPYQFKPALKFLDSPNQRLILADEVGLGKTIEAGIIYLELKARLEIGRTLVVCPSGLRYKWRDEMLNRFGEEFSVQDRKSFRDLLGRYFQYQTAERFNAIISIEALRDLELVDDMLKANLNIDLTIIDEAHHLRNPATATHNMGAVLSDLSESMLLLTATPVQLRSEDLFFLLRILDETTFNDVHEFDQVLEPNSFINIASQLLTANNQSSLLQALAMLQRVEGTNQRERYTSNPLYSHVVNLLSTSVEPTPEFIVDLKRSLQELSTFSSVINRTTKRDVNPGAQRTPFVINVDLTQEEIMAYDGFMDMVKTEYLNNHPEALTVHPFVLIQRERQAASCLAAVDDYLSDLMDNPNAELGADITDTEIGGVGSQEQSNSDRLNPRDFGIFLGRDRKDSKLEALNGALSQVFDETPDSKVLIFAFFKRTLNYLKDAIPSMGILPGSNVFMINGDIPTESRRKIIERFRVCEGGAVLLLSEVGAEGHDFQFSDVLMNYDLPWNPMKVEQRIGRIDRYGQEKERIRIYSFILRGTIEEKILGRLYDRIGIFEASIGDLEPILGESIQELERSLFQEDLTTEEQIVKTEQILESIEFKRLEADEFREEQKRLMGQGELFEDGFEFTLNNGRFVSSEEVISLVRAYINEKHENSRLLNSENENRMYALRVSNQLKNDIQNKMTETRYPHALATELLDKLDRNNGFPVTFDGEFSLQRPLAEFVSIRHPIARCAIDFFKSQTQGLIQSQVANLKSDSKDQIKGYYAFFLFAIESTSADPQSSLLPIVLDLNGDRQQRLEPLIMNILTSDSHDDFTNSESIDWERMKEAAYNCFYKEVEYVRARIERTNNARISSRISSLKHTYSVRLARFQDTLDQMIVDGGDPGIIRMRRRQIENTELDLDQKIRDLQERRGVDVGGDIRMMGVISFEDREDEEAQG